MANPDMIASADALAAVQLPPKRRLRETVATNPSAMLGGGLILFMVVVALVGPILWGLDPNAEAFARLAGPSSAHPMGTDDLGRDVLARVLHGTRVSLEVGIAAGGIGLVLGGLLGVIAGYGAGWWNSVIMRMVDVMFAFPALVFAILMAAVLGPSEVTEAVTIGVVFAPAFARVARGATLEILARPFVEAARCLGGRGWWILTRELLPNISGPLTAVTAIYISAAILLESGLSFLGLGIQPPAASLGNMLNEAQTYIQLAWWLAVFPGLGIAVAVLGFNFLGDGLRDALDPRGRSREAEAKL